MKRFLRTVGGKALVFVLCVLSLAVTAACAVFAFAAIDEGIYSTPKEEFYDSTMYYAVRSETTSMILGTLADGESDRPLRYPSDHTNLRVAIFGPDGKLFILSNGLSDPVSTDEWDYTMTAYASRYYYPTGGYETEIEYAAPVPVDLGEAEERGDAYEVYAKLVDGLPVNDEYAMRARLVELAYAGRYAVIPIGLIALALAIACFVILMTVSGRRPDDEELHPSSLIKIPSDLLLATAVCAFIGGAVLIADHIYNDSVQIGLLAGWCLLGLNGALGIAMSFATRIKLGTLFSNTVIWRVLWLMWRILRFVWRMITKFVRSVPLLWRTILIVAAVVVFELIFITNYLNDWAWLIEKIITVPLILYFALSLRKLERAGDAIAKGDVAYRVDGTHLTPMLRRHGENLSSIADGINLAVEQRTKSERLKTELITNVSHDIKTPLTSIINYSDLIGREPCDNPKITEYAGVLNRQSVRLKRLIDDLVEASKASTGNLDVALAPCDVSVLLSQAAGEYRQRLADCGLELVTHEPTDAEPIRILADGRRLWRVFDNLLSNVCKYAQSGTRVYLTLERDGGDAVISFKNISRASLDMAPEELMERFVRGDTSRSTDGNGLGLSIAQSLTELQRGKLDLSIDGDLFKVVLRFPTIGDQEKKWSY